MSENVQADYLELVDKGDWKRAEMSAEISELLTGLPPTNGRICFTYEATHLTWYVWWKQDGYGFINCIFPIGFCEQFPMEKTFKDAIKMMEVQVKAYTDWKAASNAKKG